mgnify:CR=1 FL=1|jgi:Zn-dependent peptidase ImmA (M78 family)
MSNILMQKLAKDSANKIIDELKIKSGSVNVEKIAESMGVEVLKLNFSDDNLSGILKKIGKSGKPVIAVNSNHSKERRRFTIAHEIGHFILHNFDTIHIDSDSRMYFRDGKSSLGSDIKEIQANQFAAELLMPERFLVKDLQEFYKNEKEDNILGFIKKSADKYRVSKQAMTIRIGSLLS